MISPIRERSAGGLPPTIGIAQGLGEAHDVAAVVRRYIRVNIRHIGGGFGHAGGDISLLALQLVHPGLHRRLIHTVLDGRDDPGDGALDLAIARLSLSVATAADGSAGWFP